MAGFGKETKSKKQVNNKITKVSKERLINQAIKFHLEGDIQETSKYYKY